MKQLILMAFFVTATMSAQQWGVNPRTGRYYSSQQQAAVSPLFHAILDADWKQADSFQTPYSSLMKAAEYFYNSSYNNYMVIYVRDTVYIYKNVPVSVWNGFKQAKSKGTYYNYYIKGRYPI